MLPYYYLANNQVSKISKYAFQLPFKNVKSEKRDSLLSTINFFNLEEIKGFTNMLNKKDIIKTNNTSQNIYFN